jgi:hypothetical protein
MSLRNTKSAAVLWILCLVLCAPIFAQQAVDTATITFQHVFKGSSPEFVEIKVSEDGAATFDIRQLSQDPQPAKFEVGQAVRSKIFQLAQEARNFQGADFDIHRRVAYLGEKVFRYEKGAEVHETRFNYTIDRVASQLVMIFDGLSQQQQDIDELEQKLRYDRLGVNDALRRLEADLGRARLPEPQRALPVLERIAEDTRVVELARQRARSLAERIRSSQTQ